jgi:hypothetical protein
VKPQQSNTRCARTEDASCGVPLFLAAPAVTLAVTTDAKRDQVVHHIATELAPRFYVMDLQAFHGTALLAPPAISFQRSLSDNLFRNAGIISLQNQSVRAGGKSNGRGSCGPCYRSPGHA